jgi:hypothetical protein
MNFVIDKNVPIPTGVKTSARTKYPLEKLEAGDSFFIAVTDAKQLKNLRSSLSVRAKKLKMTIVTLGDETGLRVWRTQ